MPTNMIAVPTTEHLEGGGAITTLHLTDGGKRGLTCNADAFQRACEEGLAYYTDRERVRKRIVFSTWLNSVSLAAALFVTISFFVHGWPVTAVIWAIVFLLDVHGVYSNVRRLRNHDRLVLEGL